MNSIKDVTLTKVAVTLVGVAMIAGLAFAFAAERAHAITASELVELLIAVGAIPADKADAARAVAQGQGSSMTGSTPAATCSASFTRNLKVGMSGADVKALQVLLNGSADTQVSVSGAGSPGMETMYFGPATAKAVTKFQEKYASDILAPVGLTKGTGFFGASSRAKANMVCAGTGSTPITPGVPGVPGVPGTSTSTNPGTTDDNTLSGGEASIESFKKLGTPSSVKVGEDEDNVKVAGFQVEVKDGDAALKRVDVRFEATAGASNYSKKPYDVFKTVALYLGDKKLAEMDADRVSDWSDLTGDAWEIRFTGLDEVVKEDSKPNLYVAVTTGTLADKNTATTWNVWIPNSGLRFRDGAGLDQYSGDAALLADTSYARTFSTQTAGSDDELTISLASSNPDASVIKVDADKTTKDQTVLVFDMKAGDHDVTVTKIPVLFAVGGTSTVAKMVADVKLDIDGTEYSDYDAIGTTTTFTIDDGDVVIDAKDTVTVKVIVDLNSTGDESNYAEGSTLTASLGDTQVDAIEAYGGDDLGSTELKGTASGEAQTLLSQGIFAEPVSITEVKNAGDSNANDSGDFTFKLDVTAFEDTFYIGSTSAAITFDVLKNGAYIGSATGTAIISSDATKDTASGAYKLTDGQTKSFTYKVSYNPVATDYYAVQLKTIKYGAAGNTTQSKTYTLSPASDYESEALYLNQ